jgi:hypothetical protein
MDPIWSEIYLERYHAFVTRQTLLALLLGPCGHDRVDDLRETFHLFFHSSAGEIHTTANIGGCLRASGENLGYSSRIVDAGPRLV